MESDESVIEFDQVTKSYDGTAVVKNISLTVPANLTTALVGESGSGKSTLLQIINGLVIPETGRVSIFGLNIDFEALPKFRRKMGYAVQGAGLFPHMTVRQNIVLMAKLEKWSISKIQERYLYLLELLDLEEDFSDRYPHSLSGGQQQRVSLCRAMMLNPPLMLLDEPFSALDPITRESIHDEFLTLQKAESRSIVLVTHDMSEALKLADQLVILKDGEVIQTGSADEVKMTPANEYVERLFTGNAGRS
jgi:osmoprotectant transport system ATP-binding protein